jgi:hypothetical protein
MGSASNGQHHLNRKQALALFQKLRRDSLGDSFRGMSEDQIIRAMKRTRETIWQEKLADRP